MKLVRGISGRLKKLRSLIKGSGKLVSTTGEFGFLLELDSKLSVWFWYSVACILDGGSGLGERS